MYHDLAVHPLVRPNWGCSRWAQLGWNWFRKLMWKLRYLVILFDATTKNKIKCRKPWVESFEKCLFCSWRVGAWTAKLQWKLREKSGTCSTQFCKWFATLFRSVFVHLFSPTFLQRERPYCHYRGWIASVASADDINPVPDRTCALIGLGYEYGSECKFVVAASHMMPRSSYNFGKWFLVIKGSYAANLSASEIASLSSAVFFQSLWFLMWRGHMSSGC